MARLSQTEIDEELSGVDGWRREGEAIVKEWDRGNFVGSVDFVNEVTPLAEAMSHHPDVTISWSKVTLSLSTHSEGGLTANDFELARQIDALA
ncbi:MAG: 4a-hydroxytetrahydrobiopterin dehydratase [Thermoleophilaceae bacterium]|jgi:4a-hydroxytetrahydrobiopterin dehydratase|nr:4a-hydroxytetrahydrobiopterin dehydratase [Thermoleophilaceae bacterium]